MTNLKTVESPAQLRESIGEPHPLVSSKIINYLDDMAHRYIGLSPYAMLATVDKDGLPDVSPRGDAPGFAYIADDKTLYLPERPGNKLAFSLENIMVNPGVALIFMIPGVDETYRVHGSARIISEPDILKRLDARGQPALFAIEVKVRRCFLHCGKAILRSQLWKEESQQSKRSFRFGAIAARESGGGKEVEEMVDKLVAEDYRDNL